jgi:hypothetical protein
MRFQKMDENFGNFDGKWKFQKIQFVVLMKGQLIPKKILKFDFWVFHNLVRKVLIDYFFHKIGQNSSAFDFGESCKRTYL